MGTNFKIIFYCASMLQVLGPRPKEELEAELRVVADEPLTCANYLKKFHLLIDLEEHTHMETLATKYAYN